MCFDPIDFDCSLSEDISLECRLQIGSKETEIVVCVCPMSARALASRNLRARGRLGAFFQISGGAGTKKSISRGRDSRRDKPLTLWSLFFDQAVKLVKAGSRSVEVYETGVASVIVRHHSIFLLDLLFSRKEEMLYSIKGHL